VFIYMQLILSRVLKDCWGSFNDLRKRVSVINYARF
jgi:hypothetical protein